MCLPNLRTDVILSCSGAAVYYVVVGTVVLICLRFPVLVCCCHVLLANKDSYISNTILCQHIRELQTVKNSRFLAHPLHADALSSSNSVSYHLTYQLN